MRGIQLQRVLTQARCILILVARQRLEQACRLFQRGQLLGPERVTQGFVLGLQPGDKVPVARNLGLRRMAGVTLEYFAEQLGAAPAVHQNMVAGVDQMATLWAGVDQRDTDQRRLLQIKTLQALRVGQTVQPLRKPFALKALGFNERQLGMAMHHLQRVLEAAMQDETGAQNVVVIQGCLPGIAESRNVQAFHIHAHLVHVIPRLGLIQGVKQHALLQGRQRVDILHGGQRELVQLGLIERGQREVRRRYPLMGRHTAMLDQLLEFLRIRVRQTLHRGLAEHLAAEAPAQGQLTAKHLAVDLQPVTQQRLCALLRPGLLARRGKEGRRGVFLEGAVELAQVIEGDPRLRQPTQHLLRVLIAQVTQGAKTDALVRHRAQLFLDALDRIRQACSRRQRQRVHAGEPADRAGQVHIVEQVFATMAFQLDQQRVSAGPARNHAGQGGQQQVVDLCAIGRRCLLQQTTGKGLVKVGVHRNGQRIVQPAFRVITRQIGIRALQLRLPEAQFLLQGRALCVGLQALRPGLGRAGLGR